MVETCQRSFDDFERLRFLTYTNNLAWLNCIRRNIDNFSINDDVLMPYHLTSSSARWGNTQTEYNIVKTAFKVLKENLTGNSIRLCSLLKHITELALKHTICVLCLLLLCQHGTKLRHLPASVITMLSRREVSLGQNFVSAENGFTKPTCNFRFRTYVSSHNIKKINLFL